MQSVKIKIIQDVEPETIQVPDPYNNHVMFKVGDLQRAVTEKYGIPGDHLKFQQEGSSRLVVISMILATITSLTTRSMCSLIRILS